MYVQKTLMLVLSAQINRCSYFFRKLSYRSHMAVNFYPTTAIRVHTTTYDGSFFIRVSQKKPCFYVKLIAAFPNGSYVTALSYQKLNGGKQSGFTGTGFTGKHRKTFGRHKRCLFDKCNVLNKKLVNHELFALP